MTDTDLQKELLKFQLISVPGTAALAMGLYGLLFANGDAFISLLNNRDVCLTLVAVGCLTSLMEARTIYRLIKQRRQASVER